MGLIYVNPEGPNGEPDPLTSARDIRETFRRMAMNDEETVALIAGGHTFGKTHGAASGPTTSAPSRRAARSTAQGLGWKSTYGTGKGADAITSAASRSPGPARRPSGATASSTTSSATSGSSTESPAGAHQWVAKDAEATIPDPHDAPEAQRPTMLTTDLALRIDPEYEKISRRFHEDPDEFRARLRQGLVQAAAPRHGSGLALPRPVGRRSRSCGRTRSRPRRVPYVFGARGAGRPSAAQGARARG